MTLSSVVELPAVFGRYVLLRRLSRGGMGEIFLGKVGELQGFEKPIVIKKILPVLSRDQTFVRRFIEEAKIAIGLTHANIVAVYEVGQVGGHYFLAMQYVEGHDLGALTRQLREQGRVMPPALALYIAREIANGLAYAHRRTDAGGRSLGLVHCDISPPNVLVSFEGEVKIIDFGIAKSAAGPLPHGGEGEALGFGKLGYMAPEQLLQGQVIDRRSDIYATGVLLYELLTGQRLFNFAPDVDLRAVAREVTAARYPRPSERNPGLDDDMDRLVVRALRTNPQERFATAEELRDALQQKLYAIAPTISSDDLAVFVAALFPGESESLQQMVRALSAQDLTAYRAQLRDASEHTVTFAQARQLTSVTASGAATQADEQASTSPVSAASPRFAGPQASRSAQVAREPGAWRPWGLVFALILVAGAVFAAVALLPARRPETTAHVAVDRDARAERAPSISGSAPSPAPRVTARAPDVAPPQDASALPPADSAAAPPRARHIARRQRSSRRGRSRDRHKQRASKGRPITAAAVQAEFRRVRAEYRRFERAYGPRLKGEWQQILFTHTYGKANPVKLDAMLRALRQKMAAIRRP